ncbi:MAG: hypothetical protein LDL31_07825 [Prosthecobacter sp.]|nr:hypothetical protein [Prosthecobacter sp.]
MASKVGIFPLITLAGTQPASHHNPESSAPGLPVKAAEIIYQGCMVAYDPANSQAQSADPSMPATAMVVGFAPETLDNTLGAKGAKTVRPQAAVGRVKNDGNVTAAHLFKRVRVVDDHTVGVPTGTAADRDAGILVGLDGDHCFVVVSPETARRGPVAVTLTSTDATAGAAADLTALKAEAEKIGDDVRAIHAALITAGIIAPAA